MELTKMDKELKDKWLHALRTGEQYVQAKEKMYDGEDEQGRLKMCCLGVLEHLCGAPMDDFYRMEADYGKESSEFVQLPYDLPSGRKSPESILCQYGLFPKIEGVHSTGHDFEHHLAIMNDNGKSFEEIAQFIEENI
jgi:hypothetical protein